MKSLNPILLFSVALTLTGVVGIKTATARDVVVALSPIQTVELVHAEATKVLEWAVNLDHGDKVILINGYDPGLIGTFTIPDDQRYNGANARISKNRSAVAGLMQFVQAASPAGRYGRPSVEGAVRLPQLMRYVADTVKGNDPLDVVVIGSVRYDDPTEPAFSMAEGQYPGDGHLSRSRADSPFGTLGAETKLSGIRLHIAHNDALLSNDRLSYHIQRFWSLFAAAQGGELATFVGDLTTVLGQAQRGASTAPSYERETTDKLEMIRLRPVEVKRSIFERPVSQRPLPRASLLQAHSVEIGVSWNCIECDIDLYAKAHPGAQTLYYGSKSTPEGVFWKDFTQSPVTMMGYETVSYRVPVDLEALTVAVNFFSGTAPDGVDGEVRVSVNGQTYSTSFHLTATRGIGGVGVAAIVSTGVSDRPETQIIHIPDIVCPNPRCT